MPWIAGRTECYKRLFTKDGLLIGYILMGDVERAGIYTSLIRDQVPLHTLDFALTLEKAAADSLFQA